MGELEDTQPQIGGVGVGVGARWVSEKASRRKASLRGDTPHTPKGETNVILRQSEVLFI